jgi:phosphoglycolate phosphatase-like HAD superfamily hydrolase
MTNNIHLSFDLDGTLINSIPLMKLSWENVNNKLNLGIGWEVYKKHIGLPFSKICKNLSIEKLESEVSELYFTFNQKNIEKIRPMNGLEECLEWLNENKIDWSIITSKPKITTDPILTYFDLNPNFLITSDDVENGKPFIDGSKILISQFTKKYRKIYYIGDTTIDHLFAINSNFHFIEFNLQPNQNILNPRSVISNLADLKNFLI